MVTQIKRRSFKFPGDDGSSYLNGKVLKGDGDAKVDEVSKEFDLDLDYIQRVAMIL